MTFQITQKLDAAIAEAQAEAESAGDYRYVIHDGTGYRVVTVGEFNRTWGGGGNWQLVAEVNPDGEMLHYQDGPAT